MKGTSIDKSTKILKDILKYMELIDVWQGKMEILMVIRDVTQQILKKVV